MAMCQYTRYKRMRQIARRDGGWHCHYCGHQLMPIDQKGKYTVHYHYNGKYLGYGYDLPVDLKWPTLDHKVPQIRGGKHGINNLVLCCQSCNTVKREKYSYGEFKAITQGA